MGLAWRAARKWVFNKAGGEEKDFVDVDPWEASPAATAAAKPAPASVKESVLKMASLVDQSGSDR